MNVSGDEQRTARVRRAEWTRRRPWCATVLWLPVLLVLWGCRTASPPTTLPVSVPSALPDIGSGTTPAAWWTRFDDPQLDGLIGEALSGNFSLKATADRLAQARELAVQAGAGRFPSLSGSAEAGRTVQRTEAAGRTYATGLDLGALASYEVDLWGRVHSRRQAAEADVDAAAADLQTAAMTLSAEVARTWFQLVEQRGQRALIDEQIQTNQDYLEAMTLRFRRGQASATDVLQQRQLIESSRGERVQTVAAEAVLKHRLLVLLGRTPDAELPAVPDQLPGLLTAPAGGLGADWLARRPDLQAAMYRLAAADRRVAEAVADRFPALSLTVNANTSAERARDLFDNWLASLAANLSAPLLDGGRRRAEVRRAEAARDAALNTFGETVLTGLQDVYDAVDQSRQQDLYVASLGTQLELSAQAADQVRERYTRTGTDFTRYLTTLAAHQRLQRQHLTARRQRIDLHIALLRALGGPVPLPTE